VPEDSSNTPFSNYIGKLGTYRDYNGTYWSIDDLVTSEHRYELITCNIDLVWNHNKDRRLWTSQLPSLEEILHTKVFEQYLQQPDSEVKKNRSSQDLPEAHAARIVLMIRSIERGWVPPPLIYGFDGFMWDGSHRLCSMRYLKYATCLIADFGTYAKLNLVYQGKLTYSHH
jgi:hypothetical protein